SRLLCQLSYAGPSCAPAGPRQVISAPRRPMRPTIVALGVGFGAGYVLGARAGRERYEQLVEAGRTAAATGRLTAAIAQGAGRAVAGAADLGRGLLDRTRGQREIVLPEPTPTYPVTPPSTL